MAGKPQARSPSRRRVLVDTTHVKFAGIRSGIPRVASAYVQAGLRLAGRLGIAVEPVIFDHGHWYRNDLVPAEWREEGARPPGALAHVRRLGRSVVGRLARERAGAPSAPAAAAEPPRPSVAGRSDLRGRLRRMAKADLRVRFRPGDILFSPGFWHDLPPAAFLGPKARGAEFALLVHDVLPLTHPQNYEPVWRKRFGEHLLALAPAARHLFAISAATAAELERILAGAGGGPPVRVAYNGLDPLFAPRRQAGAGHAGRRHFLMVGSIEPKKNHRYVLDELRPALDLAAGDARLTIVGRVGWLQDDIVAAIARACREGAVEWLTDCDDRHLARLYGEADALIAASEAEGFCLPLVEAAAIGCPILAADNAVAREMSPPGTVFFPLRPGALAEAAGRLDAAALARWRQETRPRPWRSWEEMAEEVLAVLAGGPPAAQGGGG